MRPSLSLSLPLFLGCISVLLLLSFGSICRCLSLSRGATRRLPPQAAAASASASGAMDAASDSPEGDVEGETRDEWRRSGDSWRQLEAVDPRDQGDEKEEEERATDGRTDADGCERTTERNGSNAPAAAVTPASSYASARETESRGRKREREHVCRLISPRDPCLLLVSSLVLSLLCLNRWRLFLNFLVPGNQAERVRASQRERERDVSLSSSLTPVGARLKGGSLFSPP